MIAPRRGRWGRAWNQVGAGQRSRHARPTDVGDLLEPNELVQVGGVRPAEDAHPPAPTARRAECRALLVGQRVLDPGDEADGRHPRGPLQLRRRRGQQAGIAAELVEQEPADVRPPGWWQQRPGAVEVGEGAAPVDISDQQHGRIGQLGHAHVDDVVGPQVQLCRAARALDHDNVVLGDQRAIGGLDVRPQPR